MANYFDQFDTLPANPVNNVVQKGNFFDQFDAPPQEPTIGKMEATGRGALYGAAQQPRDVLAALYAKVVGGVPFQEGLAEANQMSLEGSQGQAQRERPGYFTGGQVAGNIASTLLPATAATKAIGATAPILAKAPLVGNTAANIARGISASKGLIGIPAAGAVQGGVSSAMTEGDLSGVLPGAIGAGVMGAVGKVARPIAEGAISKARQGYVNTLKNIGIDDLSPGQLTGNKNLELTESVLSNMLPTAGAARKKSEGQLRRFTQAALSKAGINADEITPEVRAAAENAFSKKYNEMFAGKLVNIDEPVLKTISEISAKNTKKLPTNTRPIVESYLSDIAQAPGRKLTGEGYQEARSNLTKQANSLSASDPFTAEILRKIRNSLDNAAMRSIPAAEGGNLQRLNREYSNYKTVQKAASRVSENSLEGVLSPSALLQTVESANKTKSQRGYNDLYDIARAGRSVLTDSIPNSGTAQRQFIQQLLTQGGVGLGAAGTIGGLTQNPEYAGAALAASLIAPKIAQSALGTKAAQTYFTKGIPLANKLSTPMARTLAAVLGGNLQEKN